MRVATLWREARLSSARRDSIARLATINWRDWRLSGALAKNGATREKNGATREKNGATLGKMATEILAGCGLVFLYPRSFSEYM